MGLDYRENGVQRVYFIGELVLGVELGAGRRYVYVLVLMCDSGPPNNTSSSFIVIIISVWSCYIS